MFRIVHALVAIERVKAATRRAATAQFEPKSTRFDCYAARVPPLLGVSVKIVNDESAYAFMAQQLFKIVDRLDESF
jgi:hypothetical protein